MARKPYCKQQKLINKTVHGVFVWTERFDVFVAGDFCHADSYNKFFRGDSQVLIS